MRRIAATTFSAASLAASLQLRRCTSSADDLGIAPKKTTKRKLQVQLDAEKLLKSMPSDPKVHAELSTAELERKIEEWSKMSPAELDALYKQYEAQEEAESKVLQDDSVMQMDVSLKNRAASAVRVFWKDVTIKESAAHPTWYNVLVDGRPVKGFESTKPLLLPTKSYALACAAEWAEQEQYINKLIMPLTDMASGSAMVAPNAIVPRIDYLMSFYQNDNCYFRANGVEEKQDKLIGPVVEWFERAFDVKVPRIVGIGHPNISPMDSAKVRDALIALNLNQYQIVALCVVAQFTASLLLSLSLMNNIIDLPTAIAINRAEEGHNIDTQGEVKGYHDIREADVVVKIAAAKTAWDFTSDLTAAKCAEVIQGSQQE